VNGSAQQPQEQEQAVVEFVPSPHLLRLQGATRLSIYGFWFLVGVSGANLSRAIAYGWILYWLLLLGAAGWLMFVPPEVVAERSRSEKDPGVVATRRMSGFALILSVFAFWDVLITIPFLPIHLGYWILPLWQILALGVVSLILVAIVLALLS
jgi:hypothetical protein